MNFDLGFRPHNRLLTSTELLRQFNTHIRPNLIKNPAVKFDF